MKDSDFKDLGLNKGARLDLLNAIKNFSIVILPGNTAGTQRNNFGIPSISDTSIPPRVLNTQDDTSSRTFQQPTCPPRFNLGIPSCSGTPVRPRASSDQEDTSFNTFQETSSLQRGAVDIPSCSSTPVRLRNSSDQVDLNPVTSQLSESSASESGQGSESADSSIQSRQTFLRSNQENVSPLARRSNIGDGDNIMRNNALSSIENIPTTSSHTTSSHISQIRSRGAQSQMRTNGAQSQMRTSGAQRVPPAQSADSPEHQSRSSSVPSLNSEERVQHLLDKAAKKLHTKFVFADILPKYRGGVEVLESLQRDGVVLDSKKKLLSRILVSFLRDEPVPNLSEVEMRHDMAVTLVIEYPKLRKRLLKRTDMPWHHWFNVDTNTGFLENANVGIQRNDKKLSGRGIRRSKKTPRQPRKLVEIPSNDAEPEPDDPDPIEFIRNVTEARNLVDTPAEKTNIMHLMRETFERRRTKIQFKELTTAFILRQYPHFLSYEGEVIEQEFNLMKPSHSRMFVRSYDTDWVPKLMKIAAESPEKYQGCDYFGGDDVLNSLIVLRKLLPTPRRTFTHEARQQIHGSVSDIVLIVPMGTDPKVEAEKHITEAKCPVQPFIMAQGRPGEYLGQKYIVCGNGAILSLPRQVRSVKAIDLLFKTYYALYLHYPLGWKNVFRFIQVHLFHIALDNPR